MRLRFLLPWLALIHSTSLSADPGWWDTRGVKNQATAANLAPATIGQAKHMAAMALAELDGRIPATAHQALAADLAQIVDLTIPDPLPPDFYGKQRAVLLAGQLKAMAKPFYDHLRAHDATWLDNAMNAAQSTVMEPGTSTPSPYPWSEAATDDANRAPATLGQLKAVFSLPLESLSSTPPPPVDTDGDGMPDDWEIQFGLNPNDPSDANTDTDGDGLTNLEEFLLGTNPTQVDSDGDGVTDSEEKDSGSNPNDPASTPENLDGDSLVNEIDAVPDDGEINWQRTPECKYVWVPQVEKTGAKAVSRHGHILFPATNNGGSVQEQQVLWDSSTASWVDLIGSSTWSGSGLETAPLEHFNPTWHIIFDINDNGDVLGNSEYGADPGASMGNSISALMKWGMTGTATNQYGNPGYLVPTAEYDQNDSITEMLPPPESSSSVARIADDGTILSTAWSYTNAPARLVAQNVAAGQHSNTMATWDTVDASAPGGHHQFSGGAILDDLTGLYLKRSNNLWIPHYKHSDGVESLEELLHEQTYEPLDANIARTPATADNPNGRVWFSVFQETGELVSLIEKRAGGSGPSRWHKPESMAEGAWKLNSRGEAITLGDGQTGEGEGAPKLWRNGIYTELNELTGKPEGTVITRAIDLASNGIILAQANEGGTTQTGLLLPVEITLHQRGTINSPGAAKLRPVDGDEVYEVVTLENADFDEQTEWTPNLMASAGETNRQDAATEVVDMERDDDFVRIRLHAPLPQMPGSVEFVIDQAGQGNRMGADDLRFYNDQGQRILLENLRIPDLQNPQGLLAPMLQDNGLDLFVEIADLGQLARAANQAGRNQRRYADLILRLTMGGQVTEMSARIYRGGYWRNPRDGNAGTIAFYDGKGRYQDQDGTWQVDTGNIEHGPYAILSGVNDVVDETRSNAGPTPVGWYSIWERLDFRPAWLWDKESRRWYKPQTDFNINHSVGRIERPPLEDAEGRYWQQGSYCQWAIPGNRTADTHRGDSPPASIHFKFELVPWGHDAHRRRWLQIHPDGSPAGTAGCIGLQNYIECCEAFFLLRHYFGAQLHVLTQQP